MKPLLTFFALVLFSSFSYCQDLVEPRLPPRRLLKTNPFAILSGPIPLTAEYRLGVEQVMGSHRSVLISCSYLNQSPIDWFTKIRSPQTVLSGFRAQTMCRWYLTKKSYAPDGFYLGPHVSYAYLDVSEKLANTPQRRLEFLNYMSANALVGYQVVFGHAISLELFSGLGINRRISYFRNFSTANIDVDRYGFQFTFGSNLGVVF
jgi:hypothetical protein